MNVLVIEDDHQTATEVARLLDSDGHFTQAVDNGAEGLALARSRKYEAIIVDRMLPQLDGLSLVRSLREDGIKTPILFVTAMAGIDDRVEGLQIGADDYLTKPFAASELLARLHAIVRRSEIPENAPLLKVDDLEMDLIRRTATFGGVSLELIPMEFKLLEYLLRNANRVVTRTMLLESVWKLSFFPGTNVVETYISRLRTKLKATTGREPIQTVRGTGYMLQL